MIFIFVVLHVLATAFLLFSIYGMCSLYEIKKDSSFIATNLIAILFSIAALYLSIQTTSFFITYGLLVAATNIVLSVSGNATNRQTAATTVLSFFFWPQMMCFMLFTIMHAKEIMNGEDK